jgi:hypothetical protein
VLLLLVQVGLGVSTWMVKWGWPIWLPTPAFAAGYTVVADGMLQSVVVTAHAATGSLILAFSLMTSLRCARLLSAEQSPASPPSEPVAEPAPNEQRSLEESPLMECHT